MDLKKLAFGLTLSASMMAGCGDDAETTTTTSVSTTSVSTTSVSTTSVSTTSVTFDDIGVCALTSEPTLYRISQITLPSPEDVTSGEPAGHNVDGVGTVCEQEDGPGDVDNAAVALLAALGGFVTGLDFQELIDTALACPANSTTCGRIDLVVSVRTGAGCFTAVVQDGTGAAISTELTGTLAADGAFVGRANELDITVPYPTDGTIVQIPLPIRGVIMTGMIGQGSIDDIIIGGVLPGTEFVTGLAPVVAAIPGDVTIGMVEDILSSLYDVNFAGGECNALSLGLLARATAVAPAAAN